jgi:hypothetical protein
MDALFGCLFVVALSMAALFLLLWMLEKDYGKWAESRCLDLVQESNFLFEENRAMEAREEELGKKYKKAAKCAAEWKAKYRLEHIRGDELAQAIEKRIAELMEWKERAACLDGIASSMIERAADSHQRMSLAVASKRALESHVSEMAFELLKSESYAEYFSSSADYWRDLFKARGGELDKKDDEIKQLADAFIESCNECDAIDADRIYAWREFESSRDRINQPVVSSRNSLSTAILRGSL